jgi:hypothetical protein
MRPLDLVKHVWEGSRRETVMIWVLGEAVLRLLPVLA